MNYNDGTQMNRKDWEFKYTAKKLANAAAIKRDYRQSRVEHWEKVQAALMVEVKEKGLEIVESQTSTYTNNAGPAAQMVVRPEYQKKLNEAHSKIQEHMTAAREYDGWVQVLDDQDPTEKLELKHADWLFFFGRD